MANPDAKKTVKEIEEYQKLVAENCSDVIDEMSGLLSVLSNQYRDRTGVIEKYKSEAQYNLLNWQKCSNEMIELYNKYQKLADEYKELKERMECKEKL
jgi:phage tail tape-measure protein